MRKWQFYRPSQLKPSGWLRQQLVLQAQGLCGNLDKVWRDVRDSAWIGGDAEGWERVPYWLDGFVPMAYILDDGDMIVRAKRYIDAILSAQQEDGWICPCTEEERPTYDTWAVQLIAKVLLVYYECSADERIPDVLYRILRNYYALLSNGTVELFKWGKSRWYEIFPVIEFVYARCKEDWLFELSKLLKQQGLDYGEMTEHWKRPLFKHTQYTHIVNLTMMLKSEAVSCDLLGEAYTDQAEYYHQLLTRHNGMPVGTYTGDECLSGLSPIQGTELCGVAEQMYSFELLYAYTGDPKWLDRLEVLAFNALPATISDDMWTHQYDQLSNQIACVRFPGRPHFRTNNGESHLFGLEPNFGCCTANFGQAWPKFALSAFMHDGSTVMNTIPVPSQLNTEAFSVTLDTEYPFKNSFVYRIDARKAFCMRVRIPSFAEKLTVNGNAMQHTGELLFDLAPGKTEICICYDAKPHMADRPHGLKTVQCGSLVFSLPIQYEKIMYEYIKKDVQRKFPYCDYEYVGKTPWNYGFTSDQLEVIRHAVDDVPFSSVNPPVTVKTKAAKIEWGLADGYETVCAKVPENSVPISDEEEIILYPYGCAKLRMTELPLLE